MGLSFSAHFYWVIASTQDLTALAVVLHSSDPPAWFVHSFPELLGVDG